MTDSNKGLRILIVEDNSGDQYLITDLLTASVIKIQLLTTAETLGKAIDILQKETFDIILLDLTLPDSYGIGTFKAVKKFAAKMPVIILSGLTDMNIAAEAIALGAQDYHIKGDLDEKTLTKTILYSIERKRKLENLLEDNERYVTISKAELDLMQSGEITRQIMKGALDAIICIDTYGKINVWNPQAEKIFGWKQNEILGKTLTETIIPCEYREKHAEGMKHYMSTGEGPILNKLIEITAVNREGKYFPVELTVIPLTESGNRFFCAFIRDITERRKAEDKLKENELKYRTLMQQAGDSILLFTGSGQLVEANESARQLLGYSMEEYKKMSLRDLFFEEDITQNPLRFDLLNKGESTVNRRRLKRKGGTALETEIHAKKLSDGRYLGVGRDLTERIKAEEQLRESEEKYRTLVEFASDGIVITGTNGICIDANSTVCNMLGYTKEELSNRNLFELVLIKKDDVPLRIAEVLAGKSVLQERNVLKKNGDTLTVELNSKLLPDNRILVIVRDITERRQIEDALRQSNERNDIVAKATSDVVWDWDLVTGKVYRSKEGLKKVYGYDDNSPIELVKNWNLRVHPDDRQMMDKVIEEIHQNPDQNIFSEEYRFLRQDGTYANVFDRGYIIRDENGKPVRMIGAAQDITGRKKIEDEIKRQKEQYDELVKNIPVGVYKFRMKPDGRMSLDYISPRLCKMIGVKEEDAYHDIMSTFKVVHPDDFSRFMGLIKQSYNTKQKFLWEGRTIIDDQINWVKIESSPKVLDDGDVLWDGVIADMTERIKAEDALRESEEKYRSLIEQASDGIVLADKNGKLIDINLSFCRLLDYSREEMIGLNIRNLMDPEQLKKDPLRFDLLLNGHTILRERTLIHKDGSAVDVEVNVKMIPDGKILSVFRDIRERKKAAEEILKTNARFQMLSKATSDIVWDWDIVSGSLWWNDNYYSLLGIKKEKEKIEINDWYSRIHPDDLKRIKKDVEKGMHGNLTFWSHEYRFAKADGTYLNFFDRSFVMRNQDGQPYRIIGSMVNMTPVYAAQLKIAESENRLRTIYDTEPECIKVLGPEGELLEMNHAGLDMIEADNLEMVKGKSVLGIIAPPYRKAFDKLTRDIFKGRSGTLEFEIVGLKGTNRWLETHAVPMRDAKGTIIALLGVTRNITERKKAEQALKESEAKYRTLVEQAVDAIALYDASGKILDVNTGSANLLGYTKKELIQMYLSDVLTKEEIQTRPVQYEVLQKGESTVKQRMMRRKNGSIVQTEVRSQQLPDGRFLSVIRDLTERAKAQEQIEKEKELSDSIINSLPGVFYLQDFTSKYLRWNKKFETVTEYNSGEISKLDPLDFFAGDEKKAIVNKIGEVLAKGSSDIETVIITKSGRRIPYYLTGQLIQYEGKPCFIGVGVDITDRKKAEQELQESYKAIRQLTEHLQNIREKERAHMAREIHDELGQQLTVMKMDISWINKRIGAKEEPVKARIKELLLMLDGTVQSVRRISSELRPSLLDDLGLTAAMEWQLTEFEKRFEIKTHFKPDDAEIKLPESMKTALFRIFQESLTNVARHSKAKKVTVSLSLHNSSIVLSVVDNGVGFDKQNAIGKKTLGILGMQERTSMIGGIYEISGKPGKGTKVVVTIPLVHNNKNLQV